MKLHLLALLSLSTAACGGAEFGLGQDQQLYDVLLPDGGGDEGSAGDDDAVPDAGGDSAIQVADSGHEADEPDAQDSGMVTPDTGTGEDSGEAMEAAVEAGATCPNSVAPVEYSVYIHHLGEGAAYTTPPPCATCGAYTCECILANDPRLNPPAGFSGCTCSLSNDVAYVTCN
jgi:hypothetical protein